MVYRGASDIFRKNDVFWNEIKKTKWFYLAPFAGELANLTEDLLDFAKKNNIKVAMNPGYSQLTLPKATLERILRKTDILILNQEEASLITKISYDKEKEIFKKLDKLTPGICIMTKAEKGVVVSDGKHIYTAEALKIKNVDSTGAGDSFGSGFLSGIIKENDIVYAIQLAIANSAANLSRLGAKEGILGKNQKWQKIKVIKQKIDDQTKKKIVAMYLLNKAIKQKTKKN